MSCWWPEELVRSAPPDVRRSVRDWQAMWPRLPRWRGVPCQQFTADLWRYAELCFELRPPWVLETGSADGGTALFLADVLAAAGDGFVIAADLTVPPVRHPRVAFLAGDAASDVIAGHVRELADGRRGLVLLDDDHSAEHVARELDMYADLAAYLVVEDTIMEWLPQYRHDGPHQTLPGWLAAHPEFTADPDPSPTQHPGGWLRRIAG